MLCPEVWNFEAPHSLFQIQNSDDNGLPFHNKHINNFYYNHLVSVILPDSLSLPADLIEKHIDCEYYKLLDLNLGDLIDLKFLSSFVKSGKLTLLSVNTRIDCDNCIGIIPTGQLILSVNKETYQSLGLEGKVSHFTAKIRNRYIVTINLKEEPLQPGRTNYVKIKSRLQTLGKFTVILSWEPPTEEICPSSIAKYFFDLGYRIKVCSPSFTSKTVYNVKVPEINFMDENNVVDFVEWLGMVCIDGNFEENHEGNYVTSYVTPEHTEEFGQVKCLQWRGLFTVTKIKDLLDQLTKHNNVGGKLWISAYVQGFSDSPVAWGVEEHQYYTSGDNGYVTLFKNGKSMFCTQKCSKQRYK